MADNDLGALLDMVEATPVSDPLAQLLDEVEAAPMPEYKPVGVGAAQSLKSGLDQIGQTVLAGPAMVEAGIRRFVGPSPSPDDITPLGSYLRLQNQQQEAQDAAQSYDRRPGVAGFGQEVLDSAAGSLPAMAAPIGAGMLAKAAPMATQAAQQLARLKASALVAGLTSTGQSVQEDPSPRGQMNAVMQGLLEAGFMRLGGATGVEAIFKKHGETGLRNGFKAVFREALREAGNEVPEEALTSMAQDASDQIIRRGQNLDRNQNLRAGAIGGTVGGVMGAGFNAKPVVGAAVDATVQAAAPAVLAGRLALAKPDAAPGDGLRVTGRTAEGRPIFEVSDPSAVDPVKEFKSFFDRIDARQQLAKGRLPSDFTPLPPMPQGPQGQGFAGYAEPQPMDQAAALAAMFQANPGPIAPEVPNATPSAPPAPSVVAGPVPGAAPPVAGAAVAPQAPVAPRPAAQAAPLNNRNDIERAIIAARKSGDAMLSGKAMDQALDKLNGAGVNRHAHGLAKGRELEFLDALLTKGVSAAKKLYEAPLWADKATRGAMAAAMGTSGGTAYNDGPFIVVGKHGQSINQGGIDAVLVNDAIASVAIPALQAKYPGVNFVPFSQAASLGQQTAQSNSSKPAAAPAPTGQPAAATPEASNDPGRLPGPASAGERVAAPNPVAPAPVPAGPVADRNGAQAPASTEQATGAVKSPFDGTAGNAVQIVYNAMKSKVVYSDNNPMSSDDVAAELDYLGDLADRGKLTVERLRSSEIWKRQDLMAVDGLRKAMERDPKAAVAELRDALSRKTAPKKPAADGLRAASAGNLVNPRPIQDLPPIQSPVEQKPKPSAIATTAAGMKPKQAREFNEAIRQAVNDVAVRIDDGEDRMIPLAKAVLSWMRDVNVGHKDGKPTRQGTDIAREVVDIARKAQQSRVERRAADGQPQPVAQPEPAAPAPAEKPAVAAEPAPEGWRQQRDAERATAIRILGPKLGERFLRSPDPDAVAAEAGIYGPEDAGWKDLFQGSDWKETRATESAAGSIRSSANADDLAPFVIRWKRAAEVPDIIKDAIYETMTKLRIAPADMEKSMVRAHVEGGTNPIVAVQAVIGSERFAEWEKKNAQAPSLEAPAGAPAPGPVAPAKAEDAKATAPVISASENFKSTSPDVKSSGAKITALPAIGERVRISRDGDAEWTGTIDRHSGASVAMVRPDDLGAVPSSMRPKRGGLVGVHANFITPAAPVVPQSPVNKPAESPAVPAETKAEPAPQPADPAVVNLPLDKRGGGSLDAQIDRGLADERKRKASAVRDAKAKAKEIRSRINPLPLSAFESLAKKAGVTPKQAKLDMLRNPNETAAKWLDEQSTAGTKLNAPEREPGQTLNRGDGGQAGDMRGVPGSEIIAKMPKGFMSEMISDIDSYGQIDKKDEYRRMAYNDIRKALRSRGITHIDAYHVTDANVDTLQTEGIRGSVLGTDGSREGKLRERSVYLFLDPSDIPRGWNGVLGAKAATNNIIHIKIPLDRLEDLRFDGLFYWTYGTYSSVRLIGDELSPEMITGSGTYSSPMHPENKPAERSGGERLVRVDKLYQQEREPGADRLQAAMIAGNKVVREKKLTDDQKVAKLIELGLTETRAREALKPDFAGNLGFPTYALTNNNANIRRLPRQKAYSQREEDARPAIVNLEAVNKDMKVGRVVQVADGWRFVAPNGRGIGIRSATAAEARDNAGRAEGYFTAMDSTGEPAIVLIPGRSGEFTVNHELVHHARRLGVLTDGHLAALVRIGTANGIAKKWAPLYKQANPDISPATLREEIAAKTVEAIKSGDINIKPGWVQRVLDWFADLGRALAGMPKSDRRMAQDVIEGTIFEGTEQGDAKPADAGGDVFSLAEPGPQWTTKTQELLPKLPNKGPSEQIRKTLLNNGVNEKELFWLGIDDLLKSKQTVTKDEIAALLADPKTQIHEVMKGNSVDIEITDIGTAMEFLTARHRMTEEEVRENFGFKNERDYITVAKRMLEEDGEWPSGDNPADGPAGWTQVPGLRTSETKFGEYTLPGGSNYREMLMTMPLKPMEVRTPPLVGRIERIEGNGYFRYITPSGIREVYHTEAEAKAEQERVSRTYDERNAIDSRNYQSSHWRERNVLLHTRFNERETTDGTPVLHIEEIQSDWHQAGRDRGYQGDTAPEVVKPKTIDPSGWTAEIVDDPKIGLPHWVVKDETGKELNKPYRMSPEETAGEVIAREAEIEQIEEDRRAKQATQNNAADAARAVPDAPGRKTWEEIGLKRMLRQAVDQGISKVTWTTGDQQAERYNLARQVSSIKLKTINGKRVFFVFAKDGGEILHEIEDPTDQQIVDVIGKDAAHRLATSEVVKDDLGRDAQILSGDGLKVGGEGMSAAYDKRLVSIANKIGKKYGVQAGMAHVGADSKNGLDAPGGTAFVHSLDITPEMAADIRKGQQLTFHSLSDPTAKRTPEERLEAARQGVQPTAKPDDRPGILAELRRHFKNLDPAKHAEAIAILRNLEAQLDGAPGQAERIMLGHVDGLTREQAEAFNDRLVLEDVLRQIEAGEFDGGPTEDGRTAEQIGEDIKRDLAKAIEKGGKPAADAYEKRRTFQQRHTRALVEADLLDPAALDDPRYYHRQVLAHLGDKASMGLGGADARQRRRGFQKGRSGGTAADIPFYGDEEARRDFNANYAQAEFEYLAQSVQELARHDALQRLDARYNQMRSAKAEAKARNRAAMDEAWVKQNTVEATGERDEEAIAKGWDYHWRGLLAMNNAMLAESVMNDHLGGPFDDVWEALGEARKEWHGINDDLDPEDRQPFTFDHPAWWKALAWLASHPEITVTVAKGKGTHEVRPAINAMAIFKAIAGREQETKDTLGKAYQTWQDVAQDMDGITTWQPEEGLQLVPGWAATDQAIGTALRKAGLDETTVAEALPEKAPVSGALKRGLIVMGQKPQWLIPEDLAKQLNSMRRVEDLTAMGRTMETWGQRWKLWMLHQPMRVLKYQFNNMVGDLDVALTQPGIMREVFNDRMQIARDLWAFTHGQKLEPKVEAQMKRAMESGLLDSGVSAAELPDVDKLPALRALFGKQGWDMSWAGLPEAAKRYFDSAQRFGRWREAIMRVAAARALYREVSPNHRRYAASRKDELDQLYDRWQALSDQIDAISRRKSIDDMDAAKVNEAEREIADLHATIAAKLARELLGDYGNLSHAGQKLRRFLIPFWSWSEINAPRYVRLIRNARYEAGGGGPQAAGAALAMGAGLGLRMAALSGVAFAWNAMMKAVLGMRDDEDPNKDADLSKLVIILGRGKDGKVYGVRVAGALADAMGWLDLDNAAAHIKEIRDGFRDGHPVRAGMEVVADTIQAPINRLAQGITPVIKLPVEQASGRQFFPDIFKPRTIGDRWGHLADAGGVGSIYRAATDRTGAGSALAGAMLVTHDPGAASSYRVKADAEAWAGRNGIDIKSGGGIPTDRREALGQAKQAFVRGETARAQRWLATYFDRGGEPQYMGASQAAMHPLSLLKMGDRPAYLKQLTPGKRAEYTRALNHWKDLWEGKAGMDSIANKAYAEWLAKRRRKAG